MDTITDSNEIDDEQLIKVFTELLENKDADFQYGITLAAGGPDWHQNKDHKFMWEYYDLISTYVEGNCKDDCSSPYRMFSLSKSLICIEEHGCSEDLGSRIFVYEFILNRPDDVSDAEFESMLWRSISVLYEAGVQAAELHRIDNVADYVKKILLDCDFRKYGTVELEFCDHDSFP